ncbi:phenylalanine--tRNA ligase subunit beta [Patescibacteria group bacterium]|nr:MAG: phenylalanine--tRNA ligase subunit beta [Patescibacteria group bacterium]
MIISVNWLKKFTDITMPIDELATLIGARLVEIESVTDLSEKYKDVLVVKVVECAPLEGSDHLNLTKIDDGGVAKDVERDEKGLVEVVCGAPNVHAGMLAAWLPPSSTVPETYDDKEPFVLTAKSLRGVVSNGMLASAKELSLFDDHTGIVEIDGEVKPGTKFVDVYELDDHLLDIENKSLTHRPDTFGIIGFAREVAAISGHDFVTPEWLAHEQPTYGEKNGAVSAPTVTIDDPKLSSRYVSVVLSGVDQSRNTPFEVQTYLSRVGVRPVSAVVDVTNYLMMLTAQPLHAFDYDKVVALSGGKADIHVRAGKKNEKLELLDGRTIELVPEDIVIAAGDVAIGLAGAMGGANTVIDENTKNIIIESATFNLYNLRATQMRHGIFSEAITRFTKGQPAALTAPVLADAVQLLEDWTGAKRVSDVTDVLGESIESPAIEVTADMVNTLLGTNLTLEDIKKTLLSVEFAVAGISKETISVAAPYWRADIHIPEDIIEEVGRIRGYDLIPLTVPTRDFTAVSPSAFDQLRAKIRSALVRAGSNEILSYSFVHGDILLKAGQKPEDSYRVSNSISPDLQYYRQSLTPSLLQLVHPNIKNGFESFALFELNKTHPKQRGITDESVPDEANGLALVVATKKKQAGAAYYEAKKILDFVAELIGLNFTYEELEQEVPYPTATPFEYRRSAMVVDKLSGERIGMIGEYKKSVSKAFKLPEYAGGFELDVDATMRAVEQSKGRYEPLSRYPSTERDICFQVKADVSYSNIVTAVETALETTNLQFVISPVDIYQPENESSKNITVRIRLTPSDHTLSAEEIAETIKRISESVITATHATVI